MVRREVVAEIFAESPVHTTGEANGSMGRKEGRVLNGRDRMPDVTCRSEKMPYESPRSL